MCKDRFKCSGICTFGKCVYVFKWLVMIYGFDDIGKWVKGIWGNNDRTWDITSFKRINYNVQMIEVNF
jgi:hypothetical protein